MFKKAQGAVSNFKKSLEENARVAAQYGRGFQSGLSTRTMTGRDWATRNTNPFSAGKQAGINANVGIAKAKMIGTAAGKRVAQRLVESAAKRKLTGGY